MVPLILGRHLTAGSHLAARHDPSLDQAQIRRLLASRETRMTDRRQKQEGAGREAIGAPDLLGIDEATRANVTGGVA